MVKNLRTESYLMRAAMVSGSSIFLDFTSWRNLLIIRIIKVVKMLASTTGATGRELRKEITEIVFTISNIRDILKYENKHPMLQKLGIDVLTCLALEEDGKERIGGTGGVVKVLFNIFFNQDMPKNQNYVRTTAGEALAMLALDSPDNCHRFLKLNVKKKLIEALEELFLCVPAARILRNLCIYSGSGCFDQLRSLTIAGPSIIKAIMSEESILQEVENILQEVMIGLAAHVFKFMTPDESRHMFSNAGSSETEVAAKLVEILKKHTSPSTKVPSIRRFVIELAIWKMKDKKMNMQTFKNLGLENDLESIMETTSDLESFSTFSGPAGLSRHHATIHSLVEAAMKLLKDD